ncbi:hypothetical protein SACS_0499 [Parasaccharibacter apium]|uniref:Uncharacterized protein n=1 Tax=Parasaccharibacter apium TaxID=1510841 RepID=A0A7U7G4Y5_9PROT|nr:hypothetical protein SACS_0499 [Parasaccharibacter apium]
MPKRRNLSPSRYDHLPRRRHFLMFRALLRFAVETVMTVVVGKVLKKLLDRLFPDNKA